MSLLIFSGLTPGFAVRRAAQHASKAGCPEAVGCDFVSRCVCNFYGDKHSPFWFSFGHRKRTPPFVLPVKFLFFYNNPPIGGKFPMGGH